MVTQKTHLTRVHASAALALAAALERFHLPILLGQHHLRVRPPTYTHAYVRGHAPDGTCRRHTLSLPLSKNKDSLLVVRAEGILPNWLSLQSRWNS